MAKSLFCYLMIGYFAWGSLFPHSDFSQLFSIFSAIGHFHTHQDISDDHYSWLDYLQDHFGHHEHPDMDHEEEHKDLPYHTIAQSMDFMINQDPGEIASLEIITTTSNIFSIKAMHHYDYDRRILRPPSA